MRTHVKQILTKYIDLLDTARGLGFDEGVHLVYSPILRICGFTNYDAHIIYTFDKKIIVDITKNDGGLISEIFDDIDNAAAFADSYIKDTPEEEID